MRHTLSTTQSIYAPQERVFWAIIAFITLMIGSYIYFISLSIMNVVLREEMALEITATHSRISDLESEYLQKKYALDESYAETLGFTPIRGKEFISRNSDTLTFNQ